jgi:hypothetical protein
LSVDQPRHGRSLELRPREATNGGGSAGTLAEAWPRAPIGRRPLAMVVPPLMRRAGAMAPARPWAPSSSWSLPSLLRQCVRAPPCCCCVAPADVLLLEHQRRPACTMARREGVSVVAVTWPRPEGCQCFFFQIVFAECQIQHSTKPTETLDK